VAAGAPAGRARAVAAAAARDVVPVARAVVARTDATRTFVGAAAGPAVVLAPDAERLAVVARLAGHAGAPRRAVGRARAGRAGIAGAVREVDDLVAAARQRAIDAAAVRGAAVRLALVARLTRVDEAVAARDAAADARPRATAVRARGAGVAGTRRAVRAGHDRGTVGGARERAPERIAERLARRAVE